MKTRVFLVRHGQTSWNKEKVFRGTIDVGLNEVGFAEAREVGKALEAQSVSFIYSSPLSRAVQTATPLAEFKGLKIIKHAGFNDMNFGNWQGRKLDQVSSEEADLFRVWTERPQDCKIPGGETLADVQRRALDAWWDVVRKHQGETGMVVTHRVVCKLLVLGLMKLGPDMFWNVHQDVGAINLFVMDSDRAIAYRINDTCHLTSLEKERVRADF